MCVSIINKQEGQKPWMNELKAFPNAMAHLCNDTYYDNMYVCTYFLWYSVIKFFMCVSSSTNNKTKSHEWMSLKLFWMPWQWAGGWTDGWKNTGSFSECHGNGRADGRVDGRIDDICLPFQRVIPLLVSNLFCREGNVSIPMSQKQRFFRVHSALCGGTSLKWVNPLLVV